jgi:hypothetical protein
MSQDAASARIRFQGGVMRRFVMASMFLVLVLLAVSASLFAQTEGSIRGYIHDEQNAVLPGVSVVVTSSDAPRPHTAVSDQDGSYRLLNLPPGQYSLKAELQGFDSFVRDNILVRAGLNISVDIVMKVGSVSETVEVRGEAPLLETSKAEAAVNVSGELTQSVPLAARRHWSEYLRFTPGAVATDGTQNQAATFWFHGAGFNSYETTIDGGDMSSAQNPWPGYSDLPAGTIADIQVGTSGLDASTPLGFGEASNVVTKSGTDAVKGEATFSFTPQAWTGTNTPGGTSQYATLIQPELAGGGPLQKQHWWLFGSFRYRSGTFGIGRPAAQIAAMEALDPTFHPFDKTITGPITFIKATGQLTTAQRLDGYVNRDTTTYGAISTFDTGRFLDEWIGGWGSSVRLSSVWTTWLTSQIGFSWNNKTFGRRMFNTSLPSLVVYQTAIPSSGALTGVTQLANLQNAASVPTAPYSKWNVRADFTAHKSAWLGTHDVQFGTWLEGNSIKNVTNYPDGGFSVEYAVLRDPNNPAVGITPFYKRIYDGVQVTSSQGTFGDYAGYVQDRWSPISRATITVGLRIDQVKRFDDLFQVRTQNSTQFGPHIGINYVITADQRDAVRASFMRVADAPSINQLLFATGTNTLGYTEQYAVNLDGNFNTTFVTPTSTKANSNLVFDPHYSQPIVDEWTVGYRRQLPGQVVVDAGFIHRAYLYRAALVEQNATFNGNVFTGYRNPSLNSVTLLTDDVWNYPVYKALELLVTKQTEHFQVLASFTRSWSHLAGTWQPLDPAAFIQPSAFQFDRGLGSNDNRLAASNNGLNATTGDPGWIPTIARLATVYHAPWNLIAGLNYTLQAGLSSGPILARIPTPDPQFGPATVTLSNGRVVPNPLATTIRFAFATRSDGQYELPAMHVLNLRLGRQFQLGRDRRLELDANIFNVGNFGRYQGFLSGANQLYSANYSLGGNVQQPVSGQFSARLLF